VHQGIVIRLTRRRLPAKAFWTAMRPLASATLVNLCDMQTSPAAYTRGLVVRRKSSTTTPFAGSVAMPATSGSNPAVFAMEPMLSRISSAAMLALAS
jgi:hypothetical protein